MNLISHTLDNWRSRRSGYHEENYRATADEEECTNSSNNNNNKNIHKSVTDPPAAVAAVASGVDAPSNRLRLRRSRLAHELNPFQAWFSVDDPPSGQKIDVPASFSPSSRAAFLWKFLASNLAWYILVRDVVVVDPAAGGGRADFSSPSSSPPSAAEYLAYATNWGVASSCAYVTLSLANTLLRPWTTQPAESVGSRIRLTWMLFEVSIHAQLVAAMLFWWHVVVVAQQQQQQQRNDHTDDIENDDTDMDDRAITFDRIAPHTVMAAVVWMDGMCCNAIPIRLFHWYGFILPFHVVFVIWSMMHSYLGVVFPIDAGSDLDAILRDNLFDWRNDPVGCALRSLGYCLVLSPLAYLFLWTCSLYALPCLCAGERRRYRGNGTATAPPPRQRRRRPRRIVVDDHNNNNGDDPRRRNDDEFDDNDDDDFSFGVEDLDEPSLFAHWS